MRTALLALILSFLFACSTDNVDLERLRDSVAQEKENEQTLQPSLCSDEEYAEYKANGWDAYECDGDKLTEGEAHATRHLQAQ